MLITVVTIYLSISIFLNVCSLIGEKKRKAEEPLPWWQHFYFSITWPLTAYIIYKDYKTNEEE